LTIALDRLIQTARVREPGRAIELISVVTGPGSFTGLRIGVTTAKSLAYAWGVPLVGVSSLEVIAYQGLGEGPWGVPGTDSQIAVAIEAYRGDLFGAIWSAEEGRLKNLLQPPAPFSQHSWKSRLKQPDILGDRLILAGDGFGEWLRRPFLTNGQTHGQFSELATWQPCASTLGKIAFARFLKGERENLWTLEPNYLRASTAEEKE
jgi:tRNA threonylcarbamoyladenosine biosynthesis protein TsaB